MGVPIPQLNTCCCGCTLRTGTLIILWVSLVIGLLVTTTPFVDVGSDVPKIGVWYIVYGLVQAVLSAIGLFGVYKEVALYLLPFLVGEAILQVLAVVSIVLTAGSAVVIGEIIGTLIFIYLWFIIFSYYRVLNGTARPLQA